MYYTLKLSNKGKKKNKKIYELIPTIYNYLLHWPARKTKVKMFSQPFRNIKAV